MQAAGAAGPEPALGHTNAGKAPIVVGKRTADEPPKRMAAGTVLHEMERSDGVQEVTSFQHGSAAGLTPRGRQWQQLDVAVRHPSKPLEVMRGKILHGRASRDHLRLMTGKGDTSVEETLHKDGKGLLNRWRPTQRFHHRGSKSCNRDHQGSAMQRHGQPQ